MDACSKLPRPRAPTSRLSAARRRHSRSVQMLLVHSPSSGQLPALVPHAMTAPPAGGIGKAEGGCSGPAAGPASCHMHASGTCVGRAPSARGVKQWGTGQPGAQHQLLAPQKVAQQLRGMRHTRKCAQRRSGGRPLLTSVIFHAALKARIALRLGDAAAAALALALVGLRVADAGRLADAAHDGTYLPQVWVIGTSKAVCGRRAEPCRAHRV